MRLDHAHAAAQRRVDAPAVDADAGGELGTLERSRGLAEQAQRALDDGGADEFAALGEYRGRCG